MHAVLPIPVRRDPGAAQRQQHRHRRPGNGPDPVTAGFPSPADDHLEAPLDLNEHLIKHPAATFLVRVEGDSMSGAGIQAGDLLVVDRAREPQSGSIVIAVVDGELTVKRLRVEKKRVRLVPENPAYRPIEVGRGTDVVVWGVVAHAIRSY